MNFDALSRRHFLATSIALAALTACDSSNTRTPSSKQKMRPIEIPPEEFKLLEDPNERKRVVGDGPLTITARLLGPPHQLDDVTLKDVHFVDCDFLGHFMFKVNLVNVTFTRCAMVGVRWEDGQWTDVSFVECVGRGSENNIIAGGGAGSMIYDKCKFFGNEPASPGAIDDVELHGGIGSAGKSVFTDCEFIRMHVRVIGDGTFKKCKFLSVRIEPARPHIPIDRLLIEDCSGTYTLDLSNRPVNSVTIRNGSFHRVNVSHVKANSITLENLSGNFEMARMETGLLNAVNCTFRSATNELDKVTPGGFDAVLSAIGEGRFIDCKFEGPNSRLVAEGDRPEFDAHGKLVPRFDGEKQPLPYFNEWGNVTFKNTPLLNANLNYSRIKHLALEDTTLADTSVIGSEIAKMTLKNSKLSGKLDFSGTKVQEVVAQNLTKDKLVLVKDKTSEVSL